ncbi:MAG TPA: hypothetical protein VJ276_07920 [Thermoanaerobaculia bacterium]|nr:hypothetical protein [Thermoanaerobaculia bacterium]
MPVTIRYQYNRDLAARGSWRFILRYMRTLFILAAFLLVTGAVAFLNAPDNFYSLVAAAVVVAVPIVLWRYRRRAIALVDRLGPMEITVTVADDGITMEAPTQKTTAAWTRERVVWTFPDVWLLFLYGANSAYSALPTAALTPEFREALLSHLKAAGGRVR